LLSEGNKRRPGVGCTSRIEGRRQHDYADGSKRRTDPLTSPAGIRQTLEGRASAHRPTGVQRQSF